MKDILREHSFLDNDTDIVGEIKWGIFAGGWFLDDNLQAFDSVHHRVIFIISMKKYFCG